MRTFSERRLKDAEIMPASKGRRPTKQLPNPGKPQSPQHFQTNLVREFCYKIPKILCRILGEMLGWLWAHKKCVTRSEPLSWKTLISLAELLRSMKRSSAAWPKTGLIIGIPGAVLIWANIPNLTNVSRHAIILSSHGGLHGQSKATKANPSTYGGSVRKIIPR